MDKDKRRFLDSFLSADPQALRLMSTAPKNRQILDFIAEQEFNRTSVLSEKDMDYMVSEYSRHGTEGPTNWYRNFAANQDYVKASLTKKINTPALFINTTLDMVNDFGNNNAEHLTNFVEKVNIKSPLLTDDRK
ncbi:hypothetical protein DSO57_1009341 [Entomophthora muscae]|uniref:Uncharacterized protein n=1 Tax=Entomophthora muscae TaxID=34485 RepID=A0ACC2RY54_9FUNG|nr:hypothetical protein DSO57_1009341 [Entomophthora muscae]